MPKKKNDLSQRLEAVIKTLVPQQEHANSGLFSLSAFSHLSKLAFM